MRRLLPDDFCTKKRILLHVSAYENRGFHSNLITSDRAHIRSFGQTKRNETVVSAVQNKPNRYTIILCPKVTIPCHVSAFDVFGPTFRRTMGPGNIGTLRRNFTRLLRLQWLRIQDREPVRTKHDITSRASYIL